MSRTKSALKAQRSSERKRQRNARQSATLERLIRSYKRADERTEAAFTPVQKALDKAAKTGLLHTAKVARMKSRLSRLTAVKAAPAKPARAKAKAKKATAAKAKKKK